MLDTLLGLSTTRGPLLSPSTWGLSNHSGVGRGLWTPLDRRSSSTTVAVGSMYRGLGSPARDRWRTREGTSEKKSSLLPPQTSWCPLHRWVSLRTCDSRVGWDYSWSVGLYKRLSRPRPHSSPQPTGVWWWSTRPEESVPHRRPWGPRFPP